MQICYDYIIDVAEIRIDPWTVLFAIIRYYRCQY